MRKNKKSLFKYNIIVFILIIKTNQIKFILNFINKLIFYLSHIYEDSRK